MCLYELEYVGQESILSNYYEVRIINFRTCAKMKTYFLHLSILDSLFGQKFMISRQYIVMTHYKRTVLLEIDLLFQVGNNCVTLHCWCLLHTRPIRNEIILCSISPVKYDEIDELLLLLLLCNSIEPFRTDFIL